MFYLPNLDLNTVLLPLLMEYRRIGRYERHNVLIHGDKKLFFRVGYTNYNNRCPTDVVTECKPSIYAARGQVVISNIITFTATFQLIHCIQDFIQIITTVVQEQQYMPIIFFDIKLLSFHKRNI